LVRPPGFEPGLSAREASKAIVWSEVRRGFLEFAAERYAPHTIRNLISYLDRFVKKPIRDSRDVLGLFSGLSVGQQHHLNRALRALFNYLEILGWDKVLLDSLRKAIPKDKIGIDLHVPKAEEIMESLKRLPEINMKYRAVWLLCLEGGIRLIEAIRLIESFDEDRLTCLNGFCRYELGAFRACKQAYYAYFLTGSLRLIKNAAGANLEGRATSSYFGKYGLTPAKYLRKFAFDKMIELGIPESVADFIEGRVPKRIGAKHYMILRRQADHFYPRYAAYLKKIKKQT